MENDYNELEVRQMIVELMNDHGDKLKEDEKVFLNAVWKVQQFRKLSQDQRDLLVGMYDRMGEANY